jgi:hypothetical protein
MKAVMGAMAAVFIASGANAQTMNAEQFHQRATALKKKGAMAIFSGGEIKALTNESKAAAAKASEQQLAAIRTGQKPRFCPPEGKHSLGSDEFMTRLEAIPAAERARIDMTEAMIRILIQKFPCPAA